MHPDLHTRLAALEHHTHTLTRRLRWQRNAALFLLGLALLGWPLVGPQAQDGVASQAAPTLAQRVAALEKKLKHVRSYVNNAGRPIVEITGANLRVVNGTGQTATVNGLGNLIVGYNEWRTGTDLAPQVFCWDIDCTNRRTGSHNLIVGTEHNYTHFGGLVVGRWNESAGDYATVSGGAFSGALGLAATVTGGIYNWATGDYATVSGGWGNIASGTVSSVSGGDTNLASGYAAVVSGGYGRAAYDTADWAAGSLLEDD